MEDPLRTIPETIRASENKIEEIMDNVNLFFILKEQYKITGKCTRIKGL